MMLSITEMPNSAMKPIAAEMLNGVPVKDSAKMPPISAIGRKLDFIGDLLLRFDHRTAKVAPAHTEFDRQIALLLFAVDERGAGDDFHLGDLGERDLYDAAPAGILRPHRDVADRLEALAILRR